MKIKTSALSGASLDWAVAKIELGNNFKYLSITKDKKLFYHDPGDNYKYISYSSWNLVGSIIERERIDLQAKINAGSDYDEWLATVGFGSKQRRRYGPTPMIAAMRCFVASKLGDEVDIPKELL
jgi:hypothetical protein